jgi:hypothetical protein
LENVNLSDNIEKFVDESSIHYMLDESSKSEVSDCDVNVVDFLEVKNNYQILLMLMIFMIFMQ